MNKFSLRCLCGVVLCLLVFTTSVKRAEAASAYVTASGSALLLDGQPYQFTGVNAFNLATFPGYNAGCGSFVSDLDAFFSTLRPNAAVRLWAFQGTMSTHPITKKIDWSGIDRVVNAASKNGKRLILVLGDQSGHCDDGHWKDKSWYTSGYSTAINDYGNGLTPLSYIEYVKQIVTRYKDSPAVTMWEPMNEPVAAECTSGKGYECYSHMTCADEPGAAKALRSFYDAVGGTIKSIDQNHLVSSGTIGDGQCGTVYEDYSYVHQSSGLDVASYHDYQRDDVPMPGDQWNGLQKRIDQMKLIKKPLIIGEVGMLAGNNMTGCVSYTSRSNKLKAKMDAQFMAGVAGVMPWSLTLGTPNGCNYDIVQNDPLLSLLRTYPVAMSSTVVANLATPFPSPIPTPVDSQAPSTPTNLQANGVTSTQVSLTWNASTDNVAVERYEIFRDAYYVTSTMGKSYTNSGLTPGKTYIYYVKAKDTSGNYSGASNKVTITTPGILSGADTTPPTAPTGVTAVSTLPGQVTLKWLPSTDNVKVDRYEVYRDYAYVTAIWGTSFTNTNLVSGKTYIYYLKSRDSAGNSSSMSTKVSVTVL